MASLKYIVGGERSEVIEHENFASSIFADQYSLALKAIDRYLDSETSLNTNFNHPDETLRVVAFSGERGDGKSSCMRTVMWLIDHLKDKGSFKSEDRKFIDDLNLENLPSKKFKTLPVIDPAFFDNKHNVLEFIIGQIYGDIKLNQEDRDRLLRKELISDFQNIKSAIIELSDQQSVGYDEISELSTLASTMTLRAHMENMMGHYLKYIGCDKLIIAIDDIDLNMGKAYEMCEQLRKYLGNAHCVILISVKLPQLHTAVAAHMKKDCDKLKEEEMFMMASKYIDKLLPSAIRISMPNMYGLSELPLFIFHKAIDVPVFTNNSLKEGIVELIFQRTRYLFYNSLGGVSPIVPSNLRELVMLLGLLMSMHYIKPDHSSDTETAKLTSNKLLFKEYFYREWTQRLSGENRTEIAKWLKPENRVAQNKLIAQYLQKFRSSNDSDYSVWEEDEPGYNWPIDYFERITDSGNFSYNVSLGDVFHLINLLEQDRLDAEQEMMLFFIKSHYSIMLYESYDKITENINNLYPEKVSGESILFRFDERFTHVNELQRMVGSYFTYEPNELLAVDGKTKSAFDIRKLDLNTDTKNLKDSIWQNILKDAWNGLITLHIAPEEISKKTKECIIENVRIVEFFMLCISRNIPSKEIRVNSSESNFRSNVRPAYVQLLYSPMKYFLFDALMPFAAMTNLPFAYNRFYRLYSKEETDALGNDFFTLALRTEGTLLRDMIEAAWKARHNGKIPNDFHKKLDNMEEGYEEYLLNLLSDGIIRNGEVLAAIFSNLKSRRYEVRNVTELKKIVKMYELIQESRMATHRVSKNSKPYELTFAFLTPIMKFLASVEKNENFISIFNDVDPQKNDIRWVHPDREMLYRFVSYIWDHSGKQGDKPTLTRRTLWRYFGGKIDCDESRFYDLLKKMSSILGISASSNTPYNKGEFTEILLQARVGIREDDIKPFAE